MTKLIPGRIMTDKPNENNSDKFQLKRDKDFIDKLINMPVVVTVTELKDYVDGKITPIFKGIITGCFPHYSGKVLKYYWCEIVMDEPITIGSYEGNRLLVADRHVEEYPDILLKGKGWSADVSLLQNGVKIPRDIIQHPPGLLWLGIGVVYPPNKWIDLVSELKNSLKYVTNEEGDELKRVIIEISNLLQSGKH